MILSYLIRNDTPGTDDDNNRDVKIINSESLVGNMLMQDSRKVLDVLKEMNLGTYTETWIKGLKCGIKSTKELKYHYDGTLEGV